MGRKRCSPDTRSTVWCSAWIPTSGCSGPPWWPGGRSEERVTARAEAVRIFLTETPSRSLASVASRIRLPSVSSMNCTRGSMSSENPTGLCMIGLLPVPSWATSHGATAQGPSYHSWWFTAGVLVNQREDPDVTGVSHRLAPATAPAAHKKQGLGTTVGEWTPGTVFPPGGGYARVDDLQENLQAVDDARAWPIEVRGSIHGVDSRKLASGSPPPFFRESHLGGIRQSVFQREAAGHQHDDLGIGLDDPRPGDLRRGLALDPSHGLASRPPDHLRYPMSGGEERIEPLHGKHPRSNGHSFDDPGHRLDTATQRSDDRRRAFGHVGRVRDLLDGRQDCVEVRGLEGQDLALAGKAQHGRLDQLVGDGAHIAQFLGQDQLRVELFQQGLVENVEAAPLVQRSTDVAVNVPAVADLVAQEAAGHDGELPSRERIVAFLMIRRPP